MINLSCFDVSYQLQYFLRRKKQKYSRLDYLTHCSLVIFFGYQQNSKMKFKTCNFKKCLTTICKALLSQEKFRHHHHIALELRLISTEDSLFFTFPIHSKYFPIYQICWGEKLAPKVLISVHIMYSDLDGPILSKKLHKSGVQMNRRTWSSPIRLPQALRRHRHKLACPVAWARQQRRSH